jgi:hypothetical protein
MISITERDIVVELTAFQWAVFFWWKINNKMYREEEREMLPLCRSEGIGGIPWSPLANKGRLTRD